MGGAWQSYCHNKDILDSVNLHTMYCLIKNMQLFHCGDQDSSVINAGYVTKIKVQDALLDPVWKEPLQSWPDVKLPPKTNK